MIIRKISDNKPKILIFQGSPRRENSCAGQIPKSQKVAEYLLEKWSPFAQLEIIDLSVGKVNIQPCKGCISTSNGMHCHWKCVAENQRVHTISGFKQIKDLKIGDILQDGNKVINHVKTSDYEEIFEIKLKDGRRLELTKEHKVKILSKERFRDIRSDWKFYRNEEWLEVKDLKIGDLIPSMHTDNIFTNSGKEMDLDYLAYGLIWGDGTFANDTALLYVDKKEDLFLNEITKKLGDYIISILPHNVNHERKINSDYRQYDTEMLKLNFGSEFGKKMKMVGFEKTKAKQRRISLNSFDNVSNKIFSFLNGWISTDGSVHKKGISIYNTSYDCLRDLQLLLSRVGIRSSISDVRHLEVFVRGKKTQRCSSLNILGYDSVKVIYDNIKLIHPNKQSNLEKYISIQKKKMNNKPSMISTIKPIGFKPVYDIEVENSHEFNCEGIKIHNCSCYSKESKIPDLMYEADVYDKLEKCDGFIIITPIHWYSVSTQVKAMFDRLVCANQTITKEQALEIFGQGNIKNSTLTGEAELSGEFKHLLKNHLEGKWAGFYAHGDDGANDYDGNQPETGDKSWDVKNAVLPLVYQCRYSGINSPDDLIESFYINKGIDYYQANLDFDKSTEFLKRADSLIERMIDYINNHP
jgi:multimeric flavodoxin WrbA/intein/homing endonuclease